MRPDFKKYRDVMKDKGGRYRTISLFWELRKEEVEENYPPIFTIKDYDHTVKGVLYPSLKKIYMSYEHIPGFEYEFAQDVFGSWDHWVKMTTGLRLISDTIKEWRTEVDIRIKSNAIKAILNASMEGDAKGLQAARYLADKGYSQLRGRPSKDEVEREKKIAAGVSKDLESDMERLGLTVINGTK